MSHAVVVGVGPGLGRSLALTYATHGYDLTLIARRAETLATIAEEASRVGSQVRVAPVDLTDLEAVDDVITQAGRSPVDLLSYNASMHTGSLLDADPQTLRSATDVNAHAAVVAVQAALPDLRSTGGRVFVTGGGIALKPNKDYGVLALGKSALRGAAFALAAELEPMGVTLRMLTVNGFIRPNSRFAPDTIAQRFWEFGMGDGQEVEEIY